MKQRRRVVLRAPAPGNEPWVAVSHGGQARCLWLHTHARAGAHAGAAGRGAPFPRERERAPPARRKQWSRHPNLAPPHHTCLSFPLSSLFRPPRHPKPRSPKPNHAALHSPHRLQCRVSGPPRHRPPQALHLPKNEGPLLQRRRRQQHLHLRVRARPGARAGPGAHAAAHGAGERGGHGRESAGFRGFGKKTKNMRTRARARDPVPRVVSLLFRASLSASLPPHLSSATSLHLSSRLFFRAATSSSAPPRAPGS